jgi:uncharacterized protein (DUF2147 family)
LAFGCLRTALAIVGVASASPVHPASPESSVNSPFGFWLVQDGDAVVQLYLCGEAVCGRIAGLKEATENGRQVLGATGQPECGSTILEGLQPHGLGNWSGGTITDPETGRRYEAQIDLRSADELRILGYVALPLLGSSEVWTRYRGTIGPECRMSP